MTEQDGARPCPSAPRVPPAVSQPASRPAKPTYGTDNNNQDSHKRPGVTGTNPDSHVNTPEGKPFA